MTVVMMVDVTVVTKDVKTEVLRVGLRVVKMVAT